MSSRQGSERSRIKAMGAWTGRFHFADHWAAYRGPAGDNTPHAHAAIQFTVAIEGLCTISDRSNEVHQAPALVVPAGVTHRLHPTSEIVIILCDPHSPVAEHLSANAASKEIAALPAPVINRIILSEHLQDLLPSLQVRPPPVDARLLSALDRLDAEPGTSLTELAKSCGLSPARLRALAHDQLGVPLSSWRLWRGLRRAGVAISQGATLAEAAQAGGFSDQAHFSRTMRHMMGLTPSMAAAPFR